ncbi:MAG: hypothetical protein AB1420_09900 [Bacillota bacterium]
MKRVFIMILVAIFLVVSGCGTSKTQLDLSKASIEDLNEGPGKGNLDKIKNLFNAKEAQIGDSVGDMIIDSIVVINNDPANFQAIIKLSGTVTISGRYVHYENHETLGNKVVFLVDEESLAMFPQLEQDKRYIWFSFINQDAAKEAFGKPGSQGTATIEIDEYQINFTKTHSLENMAKLIEVIEKE